MAIPNLVDGVRLYRTFLGIPRWFHPVITDYQYPYRNRLIDILLDIAVGYTSTIQVELIQVNDQDDNIYLVHPGEDCFGFHHFEMVLDGAHQHRDHNRPIFLYQDELDLIIISSIPTEHSTRHIQWKRGNMMHYNRNFSFVALVVLFLFLMQGCGNDSHHSSGLDTSSNLSSTDLFYANMRETTPVYEPISVEGEASLASFVVPSGSLINSEDWSNTDLLYAVYFTLRDFQSPRDEGVVDRSNFYKLLYDAESVFTGASEYAGTLSEPQAIAAPFAGIDTNGTLFTKAGNLENDSLCVAYNNTDESIEALITWKWLDSGDANKAERGIAFYVYNKTTQAITIDMVFSVDYDISSPATEYNLRCKATGNAADHSFQFNYLINSTKIIAKGVSQGQDNYVIFKYSNGADTYYLRVPAETGEAYFKDICENHPEEIVTDPELLPDELGYLTWIESEAFMEESDLLTSTEQLNVGVEDLAGTINLNY